MRKQFKSNSKASKSNPKAVQKQFKIIQKQSKSKPTATQKQFKVGVWLVVFKVIALIKIACSRWKIIKSTWKFEKMILETLGAKNNFWKIWAAWRQGILYQIPLSSFAYGTKSLWSYLENRSKNFFKNVCLYLPWLG